MHGLGRFPNPLEWSSLGRSFERYIHHEWELLARPRRPRLKQDASDCLKHFWCRISILESQWGFTLGWFLGRWPGTLRRNSAKSLCFFLPCFAAESCLAAGKPPEWATLDRCYQRFGLMKRKKRFYPLWEDRWQMEIVEKLGTWNVIQLYLCTWSFKSLAQGLFFFGEVKYIYIYICIDLCIYIYKYLMYKILKFNAFGHNDNFTLFHQEIEPDLYKDSTHIGVCVPSLCLRSMERMLGWHVVLKKFGYPQGAHRQSRPPIRSQILLRIPTGRAKNLQHLQAVKDLREGLLAVPTRRFPSWYLQPFAMPARTSKKITSLKRHPGIFSRGVWCLCDPPSSHCKAESCHVFHSEGWTYTVLYADATCGFS